MTGSPLDALRQMPEGQAGELRMERAVGRIRDLVFAFLLTLAMLATGIVAG